MKSTFRATILGIAMTVSFVSLTALAELKAPDPIFKAQASASTWTITAKPPVGHHFNVQAPMSLKAVGPSKALLKPSSASEKEVQFLAPKTATTASYVISLYLCDDAKTFCEKHETQYSPLDGAAKSVSEAGRPATQASTPEKPKTEHGFIMNDPASALAQAKRDGKPLVIDFFGIWCPPCNELDERVFNQKSFAKTSSRFVRLKLDVDSPISWELKSKYHVTGYPTVVFASAEGDEISRIIGFRALPDFIAEMDDAWNSRSAPLEKLEAQAAAGDRGAGDRAGVILLNRGKSKEAAKLLAGSKNKREFWHLAEIDVLDRENAPADRQITRLDKAIAEFPDTPNTIDWYSKIAKLQEDAKQDDKRKAALRKAIDLSLELAKNPERLRGYDATISDILESEADYREQVDGKEKARADWLAAASAYEKRGVSGSERANNLEMAFCLWKAGEFEKARAVYTRLEGIYPGEFTFFFNHARMEKEAGDLKRAAELGNHALERSYGDNRLRTAKLVAQIFQGLGQKEKAKTVIDETLAQTALPSDPQVRTHRYADELKKLRAEL